MPIADRDLDALLAAPCPSCGGRHLRVRAVAPASLPVLEGEPCGNVRWEFEGETFSTRVHRIECAGCATVLFDDEACPACRAPNRIARVLSGNQGLTGAALPAACPRCEHPELRLHAETRLHLDCVQGRPARRVLDATVHEPGFHVARVSCPMCETTVAELADRCPACARSSLVRARS